MRINGVYLDYDIYNKEQVEAVQKGGAKLAELRNRLKDIENLSEIEKNDIKSEIYTFFCDVFDDEKAFEIFGESYNLTDCVIASAQFMKQSTEINETISDAITIANRKSRRATVHKRK